MDVRRRFGWISAREDADTSQPKQFHLAHGHALQSGRRTRQPRAQRARPVEGFQTANVTELLRRCAALLEPLKWETNHGGVFLCYSGQAYALCKAVNSPSCKMLFDIYHQQISEENLLPNIRRYRDEIGYFQSGDNPGRK